MNYLDIIKVSCCGANELLNKQEIVSFLKANPRAEIGIGVSKEKSSKGSPRFNWILELFEIMKNSSLTDERIALHVNAGWSAEVGVKGNLPNDLAELISYAPGKMRIQINLVGSGYGNNALNPNNLIELIEKQSGKNRFIVPYNLVNSKFVKDLYSQTKNFDVLYDSSFGYGVMAKDYQSIFKNIPQGYAGGLSADNIFGELQKINSVQNSKSTVWIDAEGRLRKNDCNTLDLNKAQQFIKNILYWEKTNAAEFERMP
ncbi:MAG: hypothetical protein PHO06_01110 [Clostridia bacterium]|jgi:hypothetical protein|nr:hypothetical protein [Clostridia bacterium]MDD4408758.1 hypothetical protein [Clostridia bacterium]